MTTANTTPKTGFVIYAGVAIYGAGWTIDATIADAKEWLDPESHPCIPSEVTRFLPAIQITRPAA